MTNKEINYASYYGAASGLLKCLADDLEFFSKRQQYSEVSQEILIGSLERTIKLWKEVSDRFQQEQLGEVLEDGDTNADILTPGEIDELDRIDQVKQKAGRVPHEI